MANPRGQSTTRNMMYNGRHSLLPPKCPFPTIPPSYSDYISNSTNIPKGIPKYRDVNSHHQRASSESLLIEEQPSWLDELLNEPETPVQRGHRRSSSDSFTYLEAANSVNTEYGVKDENKIRNLNSVHSWKSQDFDLFKDSRSVVTNPLMNHKSRTWDSHSPQNGLQRSVSLGASNEIRGIVSTIREKEKEKENGGESGPQELSEGGSQDANIGRKDSSETDTKRAKQQFAQRSRVRKLQYIAELERNVQALQVDGAEVAAELEFLNQQSLILSMENKALKQRLDNLAQEQLIKCLEHDVLERELGRLRTLYHHQQQPQQPPQSHRRTASRERLDSQFANLSLKNKDSTSVHNPVPSQQPRI